MFVFDFTISYTWDKIEKLLLDELETSNYRKDVGNFVEVQEISMCKDYEDEKISSEKTMVTIEGVWGRKLEEKESLNEEHLFKIYVPLTTTEDYLKSEFSKEFKI